jgi:hypothetical protein
MTGREDGREEQFRRLYREQRIADQRGWYEQRTREYRRARRQAIATRNTLLTMAAAAGVAGQFVDGDGRVVAGIVAAACAALATAVTAYESLMGFGPLAKLYQDAALSLREAEAQWDLGGGAVGAEIERVEQVLRSETGQWGQLTIQSRPAAPEIETDQ